jgi:hypothetical protein
LRRSRVAYVWKPEVEAATNEVYTTLAARNAQTKRDLIEQLNKEAGGGCRWRTIS